jgi:hypothetical protein
MKLLNVSNMSDLCALRAQALLPLECRRGNGEPVMLA